MLHHIIHGNAVFNLALKTELDDTKSCQHLIRISITEFEKKMELKFFGE